MFALQTYSRQHALGMVLAAPLDVQLEAETSIVQPDVIFIQQARTKDLIQEQSIQGTPDLIIEIMSPSTARVDRAVKLQLYARYAVPEYWIVNPTDLTVEVYTLQAQGYLVAGIYTPEEIHHCRTVCRSANTRRKHLWPSRPRYRGTTCKPTGSRAGGASAPRGLTVTLNLSVMILPHPPAPSPQWAGGAAYWRSWHLP